MRQKKAKDLRKQARERSIGCTAVAYIVGAEPLYQPIKSKIGVVLGFTKRVLGIPTKLDPTCTRYLYKKLKKAA